VLSASGSASSGSRALGAALRGGLVLREFAGSTARVCRQGWGGQGWVTGRAAWLAGLGGGPVLRQTGVMASSAVTVENDEPVEVFLDQVQHPVRRRDAATLVDLMARVTGRPARMWGSAIVGFGAYHYAYASGREGDMAAVGFSPRTAATTVYLADGFDDHADDLARLGPHTLGKSCLYLKDLATVDLGVLETIVARSYATVTSWSPDGPAAQDG